MTDFLWYIATSALVLGPLGLILVAALVVGYFPLLKWFPVIGPYVHAARLVVLIAAGVLAFLIGFRTSDEREAAKILRATLAAKQMDLEAANDAAQKAQEAREQLNEKSTADDIRIADYEAQLKSRPTGACTLGPDDFSGGMRHRRRSSR